MTTYLVTRLPVLPELDWTIRLLSGQLGVLTVNAPLEGLILKIHIRVSVQLQLQSEYVT